MLIQIIVDRSVFMGEHNKFISYDYISVTNKFKFRFRLVVPQYGFMHLELIPMLVGFFTYKIATFIQAIEEAIPQVEKIDTSSS